MILSVKKKLVSGSKKFFKLLELFKIVKKWGFVKKNLAKSK